MNDQLIIDHCVQEAYLVYLLNKIAGQSTIIFTRTCSNAVLIALMLRQLGFGAMALHSKMTQVHFDFVYFVTNVFSL